MTNGIAVSQEGVDVSRAIDAQKVLDSRWRYLEISHERLISLDTITSGKTTTIFTHGLGFVPAFDCYDITSGTYISGDTTGGLRADTQSIFFDGTFSGTYSSHQIMLRVYNLPITEEYEAPIQKTLPNSYGSARAHGVKISHSKGMRENELSEYALNTLGRSLAVQKTGTVAADASTGFEATINHNLGNPPVFLAAYADPQKQWVAALNPDFVPFIGEATATKMIFTGAQGAITGTIAYVIFKELGETVL